MASEYCQFVKPNSERCKHSVAAGEKFCWQHSRGVRAKWRSLTRNQTIVFCIAVASLAIGVAGLVATLLFGIRSVRPRAGVNQTNHDQSSGDQSPNVAGKGSQIQQGQQRVEGEAPNQNTTYGSQSPIVPNNSGVVNITDEPMGETPKQAKKGTKKHGKETTKDNSP